MSEIQSKLNDILMLLEKTGLETSFVEYIPKSKSFISCSSNYGFTIRRHGLWTQQLFYVIIFL